MDRLEATAGVSMPCLSIAIVQHEARATVNMTLHFPTVRLPEARPRDLLRPRRQITKSARLEEIRLTILNNLMLYHPESLGELAWGPPAASSRDYDSDNETPGRLGQRSRCAGHAAQGLVNLPRACRWPSEHRCSRGSIGRFSSNHASHLATDEDRHVQLRVPLLMAIQVCTSL